MIASKDQFLKSEYKNHHVFGSIEAAVHFAKQNGEKQLFVAGGGEIYRQAIGIATSLYITEIDAEFEGDILFPEISEDEWNLVDKKLNKKDEYNYYDHTFLKYERKNVKNERL